MVKKEKIKVGKKYLIKKPGSIIDGHIAIVTENIQNKDYISVRSLESDVASDLNWKEIHRYEPWKQYAHLGASALISAVVSAVVACIFGLFKHGP